MSLCGKVYARVSLQENPLLKFEPLWKSVCVCVVSLQENPLLKFEPLWKSVCVCVVSLQENPLLVDLVGEENTGRLADTIRLLVMQVGP